MKLYFSEKSILKIIGFEKLEKLKIFNLVKKVCFELGLVVGPSNDYKRQHKPIKKFKR